MTEHTAHQHARQLHAAAETDWTAQRRREEAERLWINRAPPVPPTPDSLEPAPAPLPGWWCIAAAVGVLVGMAIWGCV